MTHCGVCGGACLPALDERSEWELVCLLCGRSPASPPPPVRELRMTCVICGGPLGVTLPRNRSRQRFCSVACSSKRHRQQARVNRT